MAGLQRESFPLTPRSTLSKPNQLQCAERSEKTGVWGRIPQEDRWLVFRGNRSLWPCGGLFLLVKPGIILSTSCFKMMLQIKNTTGNRAFLGGCPAHLGMNLTVWLTKKDEGSPRHTKARAKRATGVLGGWPPRKAQITNVMAAFITFHANTADIHTNARERSELGEVRGHDPTGGVKETASVPIII
jgi:hypothetical protein